MDEVTLSKRGQAFFVFAIIIIAISIFTREPYVGVTAAFLFSIFFYSRFEVSNCTVDIEDKISDDNKTVDESFEVEHKVKGEKELDLSLSKVLSDEFEIAAEDNEEEKKLKTGSSLSYRVTPLSRGYHRIGKLTGWLYDPLKIYKRSIEHQITTEVIVQSSKEAIKKAKTYSKRSYAEKFVEDPFAFTVESNEFEGIREFHPGDSLRDIDWKSSSKFQKLMTRVYERVSPIGSQILLDCSPSMRRSLPDGTTKLDHSIYVALQILKNFDILGHEIGMTAYDHKDVLFHQKLDSGKAAFQRLYEKVSDLPGSIEPNNLSIERYDTSLDLDDLDEDEKQFSKKISQFNSISSRDHISGVLSSVDHIRARGKERKLVIIISDLEMQPRAALKAVEYLIDIENEVWLIVPFSPWYEVREPDEETLEKTYREYEKLENILGKMERLGCLIFELYPDKEGIAVLEEWGEKET